MPCGKCRKSKMLLKKFISTGDYSISCQQCKNTLWLSNQFIKHVDILPTSCNSCGPNHKKLHLHLKQSIFMGLLNIEVPDYIGCMACDSTLLEAINTINVFKKPMENNVNLNSFRNNMQTFDKHDYQTSLQIGSTNRKNIKHSNQVPNQSSVSCTCTTCGEPATLLTTKKEGPNKNRKFYKCCDFFKWADELIQSSLAIQSGK